MTGARLHAPAAERNREPILGVLRQHLPSEGVVLEVASGSGQHIVHFARAFPSLDFFPTDPDLEARTSIDAWIAHERLTNVRSAAALDVTANAAWPVAQAQAVICINMVHITPWATTMGLVHGVARVLSPGGLLYLYGPYKRGGEHTAPSNEAFDAKLRSENTAWGVRDLEAVVGEAEKMGLRFATVVEMPSNNLSVILRK